MKTQESPTNPHAAGKAAHKMVLVSGSLANSRRVYQYRGRTITQRYNTHDGRNKTHNGYTWTVEGVGDYGTRAKAKAAIDARAAIARATGQGGGE